MADDDPVDFLEQSSREFASYLQSYTAASVALLGRWPNFVPEEERFADTLEKGSEAATRVFGEGPEETAAAEGLRGLKVSGVGEKPRAGKEAAKEPSRPTSVGSAAQAKADRRVDELKEKIEKLSAKLRHEVSERTKANDESMSRGLKLQALQRDNAALQETVRRQAQQLEHAREVTLKLEEQHREFVMQVETADARLVKERKERHKWQLRAEKYQKQLAPLEAEAKVLKQSLAEYVELLEEAQTKGGKAYSKAYKLEETNERLSNVTTKALKDANQAREERAHVGLQLSLMADRRDELLEQIEGLKEADEESKAAIMAMEAARNEAADLAQEERRLRAMAEGASRNAVHATEQALSEKQRWEQKAYGLERDLDKQKQHVETLLTQDAIREGEQKKLFDSVSELLARIQYLGELPPELLQMSKAEALQHRDEAMRHLRQLRESHALSTNPPKLIINSATVGVGAAMVKAGATLAGGGGAPAPAASGGLLPPSPRTASGASGNASPRNRAALSAPKYPPANNAPSSSLDATAKGGSKGAGRPRPSPRPNLTGLGELQSGGQSFVTGSGGANFEAFRSDVEQQRATSLPASSKPSPRLRNPARRAPPEKEPAADWEKAKLFEMMEGDRDAPALR